jgi:sulfite exporter TauE/SafE
VGTWTWERSTRVVMKSSNEGRAGSYVLCGGVVGGVGGMFREHVDDDDSHRMTCEALCAR